MDASLEYLLSYLEDEFRGHEEVKIRLTPLSSTMRSPDLEQNYDPETHDLHRNRGVIVRTPKREYYFPSDWAASRQYSEIQKLAREIKDTL
jgi:hypothetical protein